MPEELNPGQSAVRRLMGECKETITGQRHIAGYHCGPYVPILFLAFGNACNQEKLQLVKETIELAWNNIQGNLIIMQYPEAVEKEKLFREMDENIARLKSLPDGIFRMYNNTRVFLFLEGGDSRFDEYTKLLDEDLSNYFEMLQLIAVLLVDESTLEKKKRAKKQLAVLSKLKREGKIQGVLALSNVLQSGRIISENDIKTQYRIAADVAFLSDSYEIATGMEYEISREIADTLMRENQMCTAAYIKLSKPLDKIVRATLKTIIDVHEEKEREIQESNEFDSSSHGFRKKLTEHKEEGIFGLEKFFRDEIEKSFPKGVHLEDFPYFSEMDTIRKKGVESAAELEAVMRSESQGIWDLFVDYNYLRKVKKFTEEKQGDLYLVVKEYLNRKFSYMEILTYGENAVTREDILKDLEHIVPAPQVIGGDDADIVLCRLAENRARKLFFDGLGEICRKAFLDVYQECRKYSEVVNNVRALIGIGYYPDTICRFYEQRTKELYDFEKYRKDMNRVCSSVEEYCDSLKKIFRRYTEENSKVYLTSFEEELAVRIEENTTGTILDGLGYKNRKLEEECRLQYGQLPEGNSYCIAFADAAFIPILEQQGRRMGKVFRTSRQESVERIMICPFPCDTYPTEGGETA